jgi:hypothetical protein
MQLIKKIFNRIEIKVILIFWIFLWLSVGVTPSNVDYKSFSLNNILNTARLYVPIFLTVIFITFIIIKSININIFLEKKKNYFTFVNLFLIYFLAQIFGLYQNNLRQFEIENLYLIILGSGAIVVFIALDKIYKSNNNFKYLLYTNLIISSLATLFIFIFMLKNINFFEFIYISNLWDPNEIFLNNMLPRTTGISRSIALINITLIIFFFNIKKSIYKLIIAFFIINFSVIIWGIQSRGSILIFAIVAAVIIFLIKKITFKKKFIYLLTFLVLPIIIYQFIIFYTLTVRTYSLVPGTHDKIIYNKNNSSWNDYYDTNKTIFNNSRLVKDQSTSGRVNIWITVINKYDKNKIFGYGPQADRFLLRSLFDSQGWGTNASNALIYSFACGGYIALLIFIIINFKILHNLYICFFKKKIFENNQFTYIKLATAYILFFWIRSVIENSFAVFSIDFLLFSCSYLAIENFLKRKH